MKITIWKFPLMVIDNQIIRMPKGAEILTVQTQNEEPCLWALVDVEAELEARFIDIFGTGHPVFLFKRTNKKYIGTFQTGQLVFHVFEAKDKDADFQSMENEFRNGC